MSIYRGLNVRDEIENNIFQETLSLFMEATAKGITQSEWPDVPDEFIDQLRTNTKIWSAFRVHRMQNDIAAQLLDSDGQLKPFDKWLQDIKGMTNHYVGPWLRTEYNTAVLRAHQAADWKHFEAEQDVFPNLRWMPTTSPQQDPLHRQYWESKLTLPINHPFWSEHRPGDRWNCKCTLEQTDAAPNDTVIKDFYPVPQQPGLDNNPADDGKLFSDTHPYITKAHAGAATAVERAVKARSKRVRTADKEQEIRIAWEQRKEIIRKAKEWVKDFPVELIREEAYDAAVMLLRIDPSYKLPKLVPVRPTKSIKRRGGLAAFDQESWSIKVRIDDDALRYVRTIREGDAVKDKALTQRNAILHELGHSVHAHLDLEDFRRSSDPVRRLTKDYVKKHLSDYGSTQKVEYEAELISGIISGRHYSDNILSESVVATSHSPLAKKLLTKGRDLSDAGIRARRRENSEAAKELESWYKDNLPLKSFNGQDGKRFVIENLFGDTIIVNKNFYNEVITQYKNDVAYQDRLEMARMAHRYIKNAKLVNKREEPIHDSHKKAGEYFKIYEKDIDGITYQFKTKVNNDGEYLYYMRRK